MGLESTTLYTLDRTFYQLSYMYMYTHIQYIYMYMYMQ